MSGSGLITRRGFIGGALLAGLGGKALAQGFAGLGESADGFAPCRSRQAPLHFPPITARIRNFASSGGM